MVRGEVDDVPEMAQATELIFLFQAPYFASITFLTESVGVAAGRLEKFRQLTQDPTGKGLKKHSRVDAYSDAQPVLINGVRQPTIVMQRGEVHRWRLINTQVFNSLNLSLDGHVLRQYTTDGWGSASYIDHPDVRNSGELGLLLAPGNRASVVVQAGNPGTYYLRGLPLKISEGAQPIVLPPDVLAKVIVLDSKKAMQIPPAPLPVSSFLAPITEEELANHGGKKRNIIFRTTGNQSLFEARQSSTSLDKLAQAWSVVIDQAEKKYEHSKLQIRQKIASTFGSQSPVFPPPPNLVPPFDIQAANTLNEIAILDAVEEWTVFNLNHVSHVFHIHVNPMYVIKVNGEPVEPYWCDTVTVPAGGTTSNPTSVTFRMRFKEFTGPYLLHNHRLLLSDLGMIQRVTVVPSGLT
jgi:FtsP/CotA-like multicopper oxidase with cupredoxin domain